MDDKTFSIIAMITGIVGSFTGITSILINIFKYDRDRIKLNAFIKVDYLRDGLTPQDNHKSLLQKS